MHHASFGLSNGLRWPAGGSILLLRKETTVNGFEYMPDLEPLPVVGEKRAGAAGCWSRDQAAAVAKEAKEA